jgi:hypothetical protein
MRRLALTCALFLTACADRAPQVELATPYVPADLLRPVVVRCPSGGTVAALGNCAIALRAGLNQANSQIVAVGAVLGE